MQLFLIHFASYLIPPTGSQFSIFNSQFKNLSYLCTAKLEPRSNAALKLGPLANRNLE